MNKKKHDAFTLLEVLVALTVLIVGIVAVMQLFPASLIQARMAAERTISAGLANSHLDEIRASGASELFNGNLPMGLFSSFANIYGVYEVYDVGGGLYQDFSATVARLSGASEVYLQRVTFTVTLPDGREETFVTFVTEQ